MMFSSMTISQLRTLLRAREVSAEEVVISVFDQIDKVEGDIEACYLCRVRLVQANGLISKRSNALTHGNTIAIGYFYSRPRLRFADFDDYVTCATV